MFWRQSMEGTPAYKPKGYPDGTTQRRPVQRLPTLLPMLEGRAGRDVDGAWRRDRKSQRLPCGSPESPNSRRDRGTARALLLPPRQPSSSAREAGTRGNRQPAARDNPDSLGTLLGKLLPNKFRHFLHHLSAESADPEADPPSAPHNPRSTSNHCLASRSSSCLFLPDLWDQPLHWDNSFREKTTLGLPRGELVRAKKAHPPAGEGSRPRKRYCPFRVRFADETLQDTALRYWERNRAVRQNIFPSEQAALPAVSVSERVLGSVGRWLDSLPRALYPRAQDTVAGSSFWTCPRVSAQEPQLYLSEDASVSSHLPFISRATIPRPRGGLRTFLDTPNNVDQESFLPSLVLQSVLKQGRPKGYQLLLPSTTNRQQAHR
uniref:RIKEN cDNA 1700001O22 gene n=1 Tax=Mus spicilegus TaxID=10103 RepID=A0A8C6HPI2_MUSSI